MSQQGQPAISKQSGRFMRIARLHSALAQGMDDGKLPDDQRGIGI